MSAIRLGQPFTESGVRSTYFFNGRIVSREDMDREQAAGRAIDERLGVALGDGIARGLEVVPNAIGGVSVQDPVVTVKPGLAINRLGQTLALDKEAAVSLLRDPKSKSNGNGNGSISTGNNGGLFKDCKPTQPTVYVVGSGVYLLSMAPAQTREGLAVVSGLGNGEAPCNAKEVVDTVSFRLSQVTLTSAELADEPRLRNVAAYKFFLAEGASTDAAVDPFGPPPAAPAPLCDPPLSDRDVPLALIHWNTTGGIRFVDLWAVRRRLARPAVADSFPLHDDRRVDVGVAMMRQFHEQITAMLAPGVQIVRATDNFKRLPPAGLLPLGAGASFGFDYLRFFEGFTTRNKPLYIEGARLPSLLRMAALFPPIDPASQELVWLYLVRENRQPRTGLPTPRPYIVFAHARIPCMAAPRFDVSHWDFANYAIDEENTVS